MSLDLTDDWSTLVQVMAWCRQATSHYMSQCRPRSVSPYGVNRPQWVNWSYPIPLGTILMACCYTNSLRLVVAYVSVKWVIIGVSPVWRKPIVSYCQFVYKKQNSMKFWYSNVHARKCILKISSAKQQPFCSIRNVLSYVIFRDAFVIRIIGHRIGSFYFVESNMSWKLLEI